MALAGDAQWIEHQPANQRAAGSIPSWGTCQGYRPGAPVGGEQVISLPLFFPPSKNKQIKSFKKENKSCVSLSHIIFLTFLHRTVQVLWLTEVFPLSTV